MGRKAGIGMPGLPGFPFRVCHSSAPVYTTHENVCSLRATIAQVLAFDKRKAGIGMPGLQKMPGLQQEESRHGDAWPAERCLQENEGPLCKMRRPPSSPYSVSKRCINALSKVCFSMLAYGFTRLMSSPPPFSPRQKKPVPSQEPAASRSPAPTPLPASRAGAVPPALPHTPSDSPLLRKFQNWHHPKKLLLRLLAKAASKNNDAS